MSYSHNKKFNRDYETPLHDTLVDRVVSDFKGFTSLVIPEADPKRVNIEVLVKAYPDGFIDAVISLDSGWFLCVEAKPKETSVGDTIRQIHRYEEYRGSQDVWCILCPWPSGKFIRAAEAEEIALVRLTPKEYPDTKEGKRDKLFKSFDHSNHPDGALFRLIETGSFELVVPRKAEEEIEVPVVDQEREKLRRDLGFG